MYCQCGLFCLVRTFVNMIQELDFVLLFFFLKDPAPTEISPLPLPVPFPIAGARGPGGQRGVRGAVDRGGRRRGRVAARPGRLRALLRPAPAVLVVTRLPHPRADWARSP